MDLETRPCRRVQACAASWHPSSLGRAAPRSSTGQEALAPSRPSCTICSPWSLAVKYGPCSADPLAWGYGAEIWTRCGFAAVCWMASTLLLAGCCCWSTVGTGTAKAWAQECGKVATADLTTAIAVKHIQASGATVMQPEASGRQALTQQGTTAKVAELPTRRRWPRRSGSVRNRSTNWTMPKRSWSPPSAFCRERRPISRPRLQRLHRPRSSRRRTRPSWRRARQRRQQHLDRRGCTKIWPTGRRTSGGPKVATSRKPVRPRRGNTMRY